MIQMRQSGGLSLAAGLDGGNTSIIIFFENDDANESVRGRGTAEPIQVAAQPSPFGFTVQPGPFGGSFF